MATRKERMESLLRDGLNPEYLDVVDDSASHAGHAGARAEGETHYFVTVISTAFAGLSRIKRHQLVYNTLGEEMQGDKAIHALQMKTMTAEEVEGA